MALNLAEIGVTVRPAQRLKVLDDDPDNRILECALAGNVDAIVTGDKAMLMLKKYRHIKDYLAQRVPERR